jgi:2-keto-4-pentenoate hydratase/2-oxohepta-3-ene-1,7-dioic acid hydratase in catechol pathway
MLEYGIMKNLLSIPEGMSSPVRNIFCIGRNYVEHAKELKNEVPSEPVVFLKPTSSLAISQMPIVIPSISNNVHHELELVIAIGRTVKKESGTQSLSAIDAIALGIDVTARDLQDQLKEKKLPWTIAKGLDTFAALSPFLKIDSPQTRDWSTVELELFINGELKQKGKTDQMIFDIATIISFLSHRFTLEAGDIIYTGTPAGVGKLASGDILESNLLAFGKKINWKIAVTAED